MLNTLKLVRGAVADKDIVPALTHFFIYNGRIQGANSRVAIDAPIPELEGYSLTVPADRFIKAVDLCQDEPTITIEKDKLWLRQGTFRVKLPILNNDSFPRGEPDPPAWEPESPLLPIVRALRPFVSSDANQSWPIGIWIEEDWAYATNNIAVLRVPCDLLNGTGQKVNFPGFSIDEMLAIGLEPSEFGVSNNSITFHYPNGTWFKSQLINAPWPVDTLRKLFGETNFKKVPKLVEGLREAVEKVIPFCPDEKFPVIKFQAGMVATEDGDYQAMVNGFDQLPEAKFNGNMLQLVLTHATHYQVTDKHNLFRVDEGQGILAPLR